MSHKLAVSQEIFLKYLHLIIVTPKRDRSPCLQHGNLAQMRPPVSIPRYMEHLIVRVYVQCVVLARNLHSYLTEEARRQEAIEYPGEHGSSQHDDTRSHLDSSSAFRRLNTRTDVDPTDTSTPIDTCTLVYARRFKTRKAVQLDYNNESAHSEGKSDRK